MNVLKGILKESLVYYQRLERELVRRLSKLPKGSVKRRLIKGRGYYYVQRREGSKYDISTLGKNNLKISSKPSRNAANCGESLRKFGQHSDCFRSVSCRHDCPRSKDFRGV
jgi:hypothetical protein